MPLYNVGFAILVQVSELKFAQPARRNLLAPVLIAFLVLGIAIALVIRYTPHSTAKLTIQRTVVYPTHTDYKGDTILVGRDQSQDDLYVLTTLRIEDRLNLPIFIKDLRGTLITANGEHLQASAVQKQDLDNLYTAFPALRSLAKDPLLLRETLVESGRATEGLVLLRFPVTKDVWDHRQSATVHIDLYHQGPVSIVIPRGNQPSSKDDDVPSGDE